MTEELQKAANDIHYGNAHAGIHVTVNRMCSVPDYLIKDYQPVAPPLLRASRRLQKTIAPLLKEENEGGKLKNMQFGKRLDTRALHHEDGTFFTRTRLPSEEQKLAWIGNLFELKDIPTEGISLRGTVIYMERNDDNILLSTSAAWSPLYEAYQAIAKTYQVDFVMQSIEPGCNTYINTDHSGRYFPDHYAVSVEDEAFLTPAGIPVGEKPEHGELFTTDAALRNALPRWDILQIHWKCWIRFWEIQESRFTALKTLIP